MVCRRDFCHKYMTLCIDTLWSALSAKAKIRKGVAEVFDSADTSKLSEKIANMY